MATGWLGLDWGNVPTWVGAVVTSTSVSIAAISYRRSVHDKERGQASLVGAWIGIKENAGKQERVIRISNASDAPVYEVTVRVPGMREENLSELLPKSTTTLDVRPPSSKSSRIASATVSMWVFSASATRETRSDDPPPELEFRDGSGKLWRRSPDGKLKLINERTFTSVRTSLKLPFMEVTSEPKQPKSQAD
ncbi:hypothetical protein [Streptomyces sp. NPDC054834]